MSEGNNNNNNTEVGHSYSQRRNGGEVDVDGTSNTEICGATSNGDPAKSKREKQNLRKRRRQRQRDNAAVEAAADAAERQTRRTALQRCFIIKCCNLRLAGNKSTSEKQAVVPLNNWSSCYMVGRVWQSRNTLTSISRTFGEYVVMAK